MARKSTCWNRCNAHAWGGASKSAALSESMAKWWSAAQRVTSQPRDGRLRREAFQVVALCLVGTTALTLKPKGPMRCGRGGRQGWSGWVWRRTRGRKAAREWINVTTPGRYRRGHGSRVKGHSAFPPPPFLPSLSIPGTAPVDAYVGRGSCSRHMLPLSRVGADRKAVAVQPAWPRLKGCLSLELHSLMPTHVRCHAILHRHKHGDNGPQVLLGYGIHARAGQMAGARSCLEGWG